MSKERVKSGKLSNRLKSGGNNGINLRDIVSWDPDTEIKIVNVDSLDAALGGKLLELPEEAVLAIHESIASLPIQDLPINGDGRSNNGTVEKKAKKPRRQRQKPGEETIIFGGIRKSSRLTA